MTTPLRISTNVSAEIARLEQQLAALQLQLDTRIVRGRGVGKVQDKLLTVQERLRILREPGTNSPEITPAPAVGPVLSTIPLLNSFPRVGVDSLKLISTQAR